MYASADASQPVEVITDSAQYTVRDGSRRLPNIPDVPYLDVVAALNDAGDVLRLFCVNRDLTRDTATKISIEGFEPAEGPTAQVLSANSIFAKNDEVTPQAVIPQPQSVRLHGSVLEFTFRHESVTVLTLPRRK